MEQPEQHIRFASVSCKLLDGSSGNYYAKTAFIDSGTDFDFHFDCIGIVIHEYDVSATASIPGYFMTFGPQRKLNIHTYHFIPDLYVPFYRTFDADI